MNTSVDNDCQFKLVVGNIYAATSQLWLQTKYYGCRLPVHHRRWHNSERTESGRRDVGLMTYEIDQAVQRPNGEASKLVSELSSPSTASDLQSSEDGQRTARKSHESLRHKLRQARQ